VETVGDLCTGGVDVGTCPDSDQNADRHVQTLISPMEEHVSESELEETGTGDAAKRIGQAPTTTDVTDPERSSRNTAAGSGSEPGEGPVQPAADEGVDPSASIEPHNEGLV
jgi:hypothetical protein